MCLLSFSGDVMPPSRDRQLGNHEVRRVAIRGGSEAHQDDRPTRLRGSALLPTARGRRVTPSLTSNCGRAAALERWRSAGLTRDVKVRRRCRSRPLNRVRNRIRRPKGCVVPTTHTACACQRANSLARCAPVAQAQDDQTRSCICRPTCSCQRTDSCGSSSCGENQIDS
jgi:hypothetical protein